MEERFSTSIQTGPGAHPASYTMGTGSLLEIKQSGCGVDHAPPSSADVKERVELYLYSPSGPSWPVLGLALLYFTVCMFCVLREERRLRVFENRVLGRIFGPKRDEVTGEWRILHNEELSDLYSLPNIVRVVKSRRMRWAGHVARMGEGGEVHRVLVGKPEGKRPLGRPRRRWEDNIKMDL